MDCAVIYLSVAFIDRYSILAGIYFFSSSWKQKRVLVIIRKRTSFHERSREVTRSLQVARAEINLESSWRKVTWKSLDKDVRLRDGERRGETGRDRKRRGETGRDRERLFFQRERRLCLFLRERGATMVETSSLHPNAEWILFKVWAREVTILLQLHAFPCSREFVIFTAVSSKITSSPLQRENCLDLLRVVTRSKWLLLQPVYLIYLLFSLFSSRREHFAGN